MKQHFCFLQSNIYNPPTKNYKLAIFVAVVLLTTTYNLQPALAFTGPSAGQTPGTGGGIFVASGTFLGIGTASPTAQLTIEGGATAAGSFHIDSGSGTVGVMRFQLAGANKWGFLSEYPSSGNFDLYSYVLGGHVMTWTSSGFVGIGTTTPAYALDVVGTIRASGSIIGSLSGGLSAANITGPSAFGSNYGTYNYAFPGSLAVGTSTVAGLSGLLVNGGIIYFGPQQSSNWIDWNGGGDNSYRFLYNGGSAAPIKVGSLVINGTYNGNNAPANGAIIQGNVGIGTTTPAAPLDVVSAVTGSAANVRIRATSGDAAFHIDSVAGVPIVRLLTNGTNKWGWLGEYPAAGKTCFYDYAGSNCEVTLVTGGNVGIGTASPATVLDLGGGTDYTNTNSVYQIFSASAKKAQIYDSSQAVLNLVSNVDSNNGVVGAIGFSRSLGQSDAHRQIAVIDAIQQNTGNLAGGMLQFWTKPNGSAVTTPRMVIDQVGSVGIATTTPAYPLTVNGVIYSVTGGFRFPDNTVQTTAFGGGTQQTNAAYVTQGTFGSSVGGSNNQYTFKPSTDTTAALQVQSSAGTSTLDVDTTNQRVGIGTASPGNPLSVELARGSTVSIANAAARIGGNDVYTYMGSMSTSPWGTWIQSMRVSDGASFPLLLNPNGGNVGIGTANPTSGYKLDVVGGPTRLYTAGANSYLVVNGDVGQWSYVSLRQGDASQWDIAQISTQYSNGLQFRGGGSSPNVVFEKDNPATPTLYVKAGGNVGIGTASPATTLNVYGTSRVTGSGGSGYIDSYVQTGASEGGEIHIVGNGGTGYYLEAFGGNLRGINSNRTLGIWTWDQNGSLGFGGGAATYNSFISGTSTANSWINANGGNVGIGTASPSYPLHVTGGGGGGWLTRITNTTAGGADVYLAHGGGYGAYIDAGSNAGSGTYALDVNKGGTAYLYVRGDGNVGIGKTNPATALDVNGTITATAFSGPLTGNLSAAYVTPGSFGSASTQGNYTFGSTNNTSSTATLAVTNPGGTVFDVDTLNSRVGIGTASPANQLTVGSLNGQSNALISVRTCGTAPCGNALEFGHSNPAGYGSTIGANASNGRPFLAFNAEAGSTSNTFRTRGIVGRIISADLSGGILFSRATNSNADNQTLTDDVTINSSGNVGIGTTYSNGKLNFQADSNTVLISTTRSDNTQQGYFASDGWGSWYTNHALWIGYTPPGTCCQSGLNVNGNVGIGTTTPAQLLTVNGGQIKIVDGAGTGGYLDANSGGILIKGLNGTIGAYIYDSNQWMTGNLIVGSASGANSKLDVYNGDLQVESGEGRFKGWYNAGSGLGAEIGISGGQGYILTYNRTSAAYASTTIQANGAQFTVDAANQFTFIGGNVGIGTASPAGKLESQTTAVDNLWLSTGPNNTTDYRLTAGASTAGYAYIFGSRRDGGVSAPLLLGGYPGNISYGNVGIGTASPQVKLQVNGTAGAVSIATNGDIGGGNTSGTAGSGGNTWTFHGAGTSNGWVYLQNGNNSAYHDLALGNLWVNGTLESSGSNVNTQNLIVNGGTGKVTTGTVDPVYTIGGVKYATYLPGMTGVKEETTGVAKLNNESGSRNYEYVIDFSKAEKGSDNWLFAKTTNLANKGLANLVAILTPSFDGKVWYEKDAKNLKITIFAIPNSSFIIPNSPLEVSYRLSAPRFDSAEWTNYAPADAPTGLNLDSFYSK